MRVPVAIPLLMLSMALFPVPPAWADSHAALSTLTVTGEGMAEATPDLATISMGVTTQGDSAAAAMAANTAALQAVMDRLVAAGIEARDIQTSNLSLNPNWTQSADGSQSVISGYIASNQVTVRVRDVAKVGPVLDAAVADGANTLNGISFGLQDDSALREEARTEAVADARARAQTLAGAAGVQLKRIVSIAEGGGFAPPQPMYRMEAAMAGDVPVAGGEVGVTASVTVIYEIE
ncbi:MAG: hypothetical protein RIR62_194 [Pseudomonadota bacterium]|jgi:uncharacterized protein YggE